jgi:hypothetical protein
MVRKAQALVLIKRQPFFMPKPVPNKEVSEGENGK